MRILNYRILFGFLALTILVGCSTGNKFATRKYTKGYYVDFISKQKVEPRITQNETSTTQIIPIKHESQAIPIASVNNVNTALKKAHPVGGKHLILKTISPQKQQNEYAAKVLEKSVFANALQLPADTAIPVAQHKDIIAKVCLAVGAISVVAGILTTSGVLLGGGLLLLVIGATSFKRAPVQPKPELTQEQKDKKHAIHEGIGIGCILGGIVIIVVGLIIAGSSNAGIDIILAPMYIGLVIALLGLIICAAG